MEIRVFNGLLQLTDTLGLLLLASSLSLSGCGGKRVLHNMLGTIPADNSFIDSCKDQNDAWDKVVEGKSVSPPKINSGAMADRANWCIPNYFSEANLDKLFEQERWRGPQHDSIGLALSGGGTKAADFSVGVIAGSYEKLLKPGHIQVISSASGGGYAALWYLSRLLDAYANVPNAAGAVQDSIRFDAVFDDCLPRRYLSLVDLSEGPPKAALCPDNLAHVPLVSSNFGVENQDPYRYQTQLRGFQDILSNDYNIEESKYPFNESNKGIAGDTGKASLLTVIGFLPYHFANTLFDWRVQSFSREQYSKGIERTFDLMPPKCVLEQAVEDASVKSLGNKSKVVQRERYGASDSKYVACRDYRYVPNRLASRGHTFAAMRLVREMQWEDQLTREKDDRHERAVSSDTLPPTSPAHSNSDRRLPPLPFWIANTTAATRTQLSETFSRGFYDVRAHVFEFTPTGFGSRRFGYWEGSHPDIDTVEATVASGGFFDAQERNIDQPARIFVNLGLRLATLEWGRDIDNPNQIDSVRGWHLGLPVPFYFLDPQALSITPPGRIHLSDGGQSENTGIYSLVRRGIKQIVFTDGASDARGQFSDLCKIRQQLLAYDIALTMDDLDQFDDFCDGKLAADQGYDLWDAPARVLKGRIFSISPGQPSCFHSTDCDGYFAELFVLKPMLPWKGKGNLSDIVSKCLRPDNLEDSDNSEPTPCRTAFKKARAVFPWVTEELFGYLASRQCKGTRFPQHGTAAMTFNSSSSRFGAYRELGRAMTSTLMVNKEKRRIYLSDRTDEENAGAKDSFVLKISSINKHPRLEKFESLICPLKDVPSKLGPDDD